MKTMVNLFGILFLIIAVSVACGNQKDEQLPSRAEQTKPGVMGDNSSAYSWPEGRRYYYSFDEKIYVDKVPDKAVVCFDEKYLSEIERYLHGNDKIKESHALNPTLYVLTVAENTNATAFAADLEKQAGVKSVNPVYVQADFIGSELYFTDEISVLFKDDVSRQEMAELYEKYGVKETRDPYRHLFPEHRRILSAPVDADLLGIANAIYESGRAVYSYPNFVAKVNNGPGPWN